MVVEIKVSYGASVSPFYQLNLLHCLKDSSDLLESPEAITGSGSLLSSSESDRWAGRPAGPWNPTDNISPTAPGSHVNVSAIHHYQNSSQLASQVLADPNSGNSTYFSMPSKTALGQGNGNKQPRQLFLDPSASNLVANAFEQAQADRSSRHNSNEENRYSAKALAIGASDQAPKVRSGRQSIQQQSFSGYNNVTVSRSGSLPPSTSNGVERSSRFNDESVRLQHSNFATLSSTTLHRSNLSANPSYPARFGPYENNTGDQRASKSAVLSIADLNKTNVGLDNQYSSHTPQKDSSNTSNGNGYLHDYPHQLGLYGTSESWAVDENGYARNPGLNLDGVISDPSLPNGSQPRGASTSTSYSHSPRGSDPRRGQHSPFFPTGGTPPSGMHPRFPNGNTGFNLSPNATLLESKLRGPQIVQQEQQIYTAPPNPIFRPSYAQSYEFHPQNALRMNPLAPYYHHIAPLNLLAPHAPPRGPARDHDAGQHLRSALLDEFRNSNKTNKRYELKVGSEILYCCG